VRVVGTALTVHVSDPQVPMSSDGGMAVPVVVVVVVVDWEPVSFPDGEIFVLLDVLPIESNVFSISLVTALFMESERL